MINNIGIICVKTKALKRRILLIGLYSILPTEQTGANSDVFNCALGQVFHKMQWFIIC